jgi:hypothetical protein
MCGGWVYRCGGILSRRVLPQDVAQHFFVLEETDKRIGYKDFFTRKEFIRCLDYINDVRHNFSEYPFSFDIEKSTVCKKRNKN